MIYWKSKLILWIMTGMMAVLTMFFNLFIFLANLGSYRKNKQWCPSETIITALSMANIAYQLVSYFWMTMGIFDRYCYLPRIPYSVMLLAILSLKFTIMWISAFLTFYYSTKLVIAPIHCYTKIQAAILRHVTTVVLFIPLCALGTCMPMLVLDNHGNSTMECGAIVSDNIFGRVYEIMILILSNLVPGSVMIKSCVSISVHLAIHLRHMKASTNSSHAPKLGDQMRVIHMTLSLVAVFLCYLVVELYAHFQKATPDGDILLTLFFTSVYTTFSALVLIYGKKTFWKALVNVCLDGFPCLSFLQAPVTTVKH